VRGFVDRKPVWLVRPLGLKTVQKTAETMEVETRRFYEAVRRRTTDTGIRQLLGDLAEEERIHAHTAEQISLTWIRHRFMDTPWTSAFFQVALGGALVLLAGILVGVS